MREETTGSCSACDRGMAARFFAFMGCDNLEHPLEKPKKQCRMKTHPLWTQIRPCAHTPSVLHSAQARQGFSPISRSKIH